MKRALLLLCLAVLLSGCGAVMRDPENLKLQSVTKSTQYNGSYCYELSGDLHNMIFYTSITSPPSPSVQIAICYKDGDKWVPFPAVARGW